MIIVRGGYLGTESVALHPVRRLVLRRAAVGPRWRVDRATDPKNGRI